MADFQNRLIPRIFGVFSDHFAKAIAFAWAIALQDGKFSKSSYFLNSWCLFERFFAQNNFNVLVPWFFTCFWHF